MSAPMFDTQELRAYTEREVASLRRDINELRESMHKELQEIRRDISETQLKIASLRVDMTAMKAEILKWVAGLLVAQGSFIVAAIKLL